MHRKNNIEIWEKIGDFWMLTTTNKETISRLNNNPSLIFQKAIVGFSIFLIPKNQLSQINKLLDSKQ